MRKALVVGLGALFIFSLVGFVSTNAETETVPSITNEQDILCRNSENGLQFSLDGSEWVSQSDYEQNLPEIDWWTASEYEIWISEQKTELEALIGTDNGWYDGQGVYHEWTQESVNNQIAQYEETLKEIKAGILYAKPNKDGIGYSQIPPNEDDVIFAYSTDFVKSDGTTIHIGDYESENELKEAINNAVEDGKITKEEANSIGCQ